MDLNQQESSSVQRYRYHKVWASRENDSCRQSLINSPIDMTHTNLERSHKYIDLSVIDGMLE